MACEDLHAIRPKQGAMRTAAVSLLLAVAAVSGCSSSSSPGSSAPKQPPVSAFPAGTCRVSAPDVLAIGRVAGALGKGGDVSSDALSRLTTAQERLIQLAGGAEPAYQPSLKALTVSVGLIRLAAKVGSYRPAQGVTLGQRYRAVLKACGVAQ